MNQTSFLIIGDSPDLHGGLSRIGRDIAVVASRMPELKVGYFGMAGSGSSHLPFMQYCFPENGRWGADHFWRAWEDFSRGFGGVVMTVWDPSRLLWLLDPESERCKNRDFKLWGYFPIDGHNRFTGMSPLYTAAGLHGFDRHLAYGKYGKAVIESTLAKEADWLPHGINLEVFKPQERKDPEVFRVGCVMTNQLRKDWGLAFEIFARLQREHENLRLWIHTNWLKYKWDLQQLSIDFSINPEIIEADQGSGWDDKEMADKYSQCDVTILPSGGEGFGYPIVESMACGVPCVHVNYAGGAELVPNKKWLVEPDGWYYNEYGISRPSTSAENWVKVVDSLKSSPPDKDILRQSVEHLDWKNLYIPWQRWIREGL